MRHNDVAQPLPLVCSIDHGRLKHFLGYSLKTSIENDEAEREEMPNSVNHQHYPGQRC